MSYGSPTLPGTSTVVPDAEPIVGLVSESEKKIRKKNTTKIGKPPPATEPTTVEATPPTTPPEPKSKPKAKPKPKPRKKKPKIPKKPKVKVTKPKNPKTTKPKTTKQLAAAVIRKYSSFAKRKLAEKEGQILTVKYNNFAKRKRAEQPAGGKKKKSKVEDIENNTRVGKKSIVSKVYNAETKDTFLSTQ